jgi:hypothetical protein
LPDKAVTDVNPALLSQAVSDPRGAIIAAWLTVEDAAREAVVRHGLLEPKMAKNPISIVRALQKAEVLDVQYIAMFNALRDLRNRAAHDSDFSPSAESVIDYVRLAADLAAALKQAPELRGW